MISSIITKFVAKQMAKSKGVIANKKAVEFSSAAMEDRLMRNGFDPNAIKSESELLAVLNSIKQKENLAFQREFKDIFTRKDAKVFDLQGNKIDTSKPIMGGKNIPETEEQFLTRIQKENKESAERLREKKDIKDPEDMATGGRVGLKDGPKFNFAATGSKSGKQQIEKAPAGITRDQETFQAIMNADIPLNDKLNFLANLQYSKDRVRIDKDKDELFLFEGGSKDREFGLGYNEGKEGFSGRVMYNIDTNEPKFKIGFSKKFADGGRAEFKSGLGKGFLNFLKGLTKEKPFSGKEFVEKRKFIGADKIENKINQIKNEKVLKEAQEEFRKNPPVKFPEPGSKEYEEVLARVQRRLMGDRKLNATGGRVGLKDGMDRRTFLKIMGGLASIPILGKFFKGAKVAKGTKVASDVASTVSKSTPPPYFFELAKTIKKFGKPDKVTYQDRVEVHRMLSKDGKSELQLTEDLSTGDMQIKKIKPEEDMVNEDIVLEFKKGDVDVDPKTGKGIKEPDEYTEGKEVTQRIYKDNYNETDFYEGEGVDEIIKEVREAPPIKKAGGGVAYMLGE